MSVQAACSGMREGDRVEGRDSPGKPGGVRHGGRAGALETQKASTAGVLRISRGGDQREVGGGDQTRLGLEGEGEEGAYRAPSRGVTGSDSHPFKKVTCSVEDSLEGSKSERREASFTGRR